LKPTLRGVTLKVCVIGLGEVGLPTARYFLSKGLQIWGYDVKPDAIVRANQNGIIKATLDWYEIPSSDVYVICVSSALKKNKMPNLNSILDVCEKIAGKAHHSSLVSIESTIVPFTSRKIHEDIFKRNLSLVHVPHRYWAGDPLNRGVKQLRVIGAVNEESLTKGVRFYKDVVEIPLHIAPSIEVAEMSKISENAYRYVQIAFAEELKMICKDLGLRFEEIREACNTKWNVEMLEARDGIKGHCLPKDIEYVISLATHNTLLKSAVIVDEMYNQWISGARVHNNRS